MVEISVAEARKGLMDVLNRAAYGGERLVLQRRGKSVAAVVSMEDLRLLQEIEDRADVRAGSRPGRKRAACPWKRSRPDWG